MKISKSREKYLLQKYFYTKNVKNIPNFLSQFGFRDSDTSDEDLFFVTKYVSNINRLSLGGSLITKNGLEYLKKIKIVAYLDLAEVPLDDSNLDCILHLKEVNYLYIKHTNVSVNGISKILKNFTMLENLVAEINTQDKDVLEFWIKEYPNCEFNISLNNKT